MLSSIMSHKYLIISSSLTLQGPVQFNSNGSREARVIRVQQYDVTGTVTRPTVANVMINTNSSELIFKEDFGVTSLWLGKLSIGSYAGEIVIVTVRIGSCHSFWKFPQPIGNFKSQFSE